ncbi:MAG: tetratricopeptide repeat protein [Phycisphaerae bacterium]
MQPPVNENLRLSTRPMLPTAHPPGGFPSSLRSAPAEQDAKAAGSDWQIILQLKTLFERDPALISSLAEEVDGNQPATYATRLMAAGREALAARPDSADLQYPAARAAARIGTTRAAADLLERALEINPCHVAASVLLSDICLALKEPQRAVVWPQRALTARAAPADEQPAGGRNRRGNELFT